MRCGVGGTYSSDDDAVISRRITIRWVDWKDAGAMLERRLTSLQLEGNDVRKRTSEATRRDGSGRPARPSAALLTLQPQTYRVIICTPTTR